MRKEMLVCAETKEKALAKLKDEVQAYLRARNVKAFRWATKPEARQGYASGEWRAYARIEFEK
jgi:hypothetical protein